MGFVHKETTQSLSWLDFYGLLREAGEYTPFQVQQFLDGTSDVLNGTISEMSAAAGAEDAERVSQAEAAGEAIMAVGAAVATIGSESVIAIVVGAVVAAIGAVIKWLAKYFVIECDKYHCEGYDRKTNTQKKIYRSHQRTLVGVYIPDSWELYAKSDCSCSHNYHHCSFIRYMHDGLMIDGIERSTLKPGGTTLVGRVRGANGIAGGGNAGCVEHWRNKSESKPVDKNGNDIPKGKETKVEKAYLNDRNSYYYRAWKVHHVLSWMQEHVLCRTMECMEKVLLNTSKTDEESEFNQKRRRGSRWYASIVWMMKDLWFYGQKIGWTKLEQFMREAKASQAALDALKKMKRGDKFDQKDLPFEWWPLTSQLTFWQIRDILIKMKPLFPYEQPAKTMPEGQEARERTIELKPLMLPIRTSIVYGRDMKPVPAKIGSRGPGAGAVVLGGTAAVVGAYAIYKLMSRR